jgi:predicted permease
MGAWSRFTRTLFGGSHREDIREELEFHIAMDVHDGREPRDARLRLGNTTRIAEDTRAMGVVAWLESVGQDVHYGWRQLRHAPRLTAAVVLSLAIGLGANTAIATLVDAALLRPLPLPDAGELQVVEWTNAGWPPGGAVRVRGRAQTIEGGRMLGTSISEPLYRAFAAEQTAFDSIVGVGSPRGLLSVSRDRAPAEQLNGRYVSANFFSALGVHLVLGRPFLDEEDRAGAAPVAIVSHRFWASRLGSDAGALERPVRVNNTLVPIVGVAPPGFFGLTIGEWADVYVPLASRDVIESFDPLPPGGASDFWWVRLMARSKPSDPDPAALAEASLLLRSLASATTGTAQETGLELVTRPGRRGFEPRTPAERRALGILVVLVGVLLLIVCANVANLLLSRSVQRQHESAVRLALGAGRIRLFRQHLVESGIFAALGGVAGVGLGYVLARALHTVFQAGTAPGSAFSLQLDLRILGFSAALGILTALLCGLAPSLRAVGADVHGALAAHGRAVIGGRLRGPKLLVAIQFALCLAALVAAGLLSRTLQNLGSTEVGFDAEGLSYATVNPVQAGQPRDRIASYLTRLEDAFAAIPGVVNVAPLKDRMLQGGGSFNVASTPDGPPPRVDGISGPNPDAMVIENLVGSDLLETLRVPVLSGRPFTALDLQMSRRVALVDEVFAARFFPGQDPIGRSFTWSGASIAIIGVVRTTRQMGLRQDAMPTVYLPLGAEDVDGPVYFAIRAALPPEHLAAAVRQAAASVDPTVPVTELHTQEGLINRILRTERLLALVSVAFSVIAVTLAAIGLGGLLAYAIARRTNELGIRMTLGASARDLSHLVMRDALSMLAAGVLLGLPIAYLVARYLQASLFELQPADPLIAALSLTSLTAVALVAAWLPAHRAARISPVDALREL